MKLFVDEEYQSEAGVIPGPATILAQDERPRWKRCGTNAGAGIRSFGWLAQFAHLGSISTDLADDGQGRHPTLHHIFRDHQFLEIGKRWYLIHDFEHQLFEDDP